ncbi:hypothetical protein, partial [Pseudomonas mediterranea]|uniref:hypothetical protein n=1 Tax=Pseudomonas mediterranea TaxID=183795 RepID=UPI001E2FC941
RQNRLPVARELAPAGVRSAPNTCERFALEREQAPSPQRHSVRRLADIGAILPLFSCLEISGILPAGNFIAGLKYMTQGPD